MDMIVYIASPYSSNPEEGVEKQIDAFNSLMTLHTPIAPLLFHYVDKKYPHHYEEWMEICFQYIKLCDVVLRLPGYSPGADREINFARSLGKEIVYDVNLLS
ncbi:MAG: DUF4406 domain-containing protein [Nitrospirae bacterium]|nr:DUF4406 domain-containing protein [Nitrospirota bacterium]